MRTSLRVFSAAISTLLLAAFMTVIPFGQPANAVVGLHTVSVAPEAASYAEGAAGTFKTVNVVVHLNVQNFVPTATIEGDVVAENGTARDGKDFTSQTKHFAFPGGQFVNNSDIVLTFTNLITGDNFAEPDETITLTVKNLEQASFAGSTPVKIANDDAAPADFVITKSPNAAEGNGDNGRTVMVALSKNADQETTLNWATSDFSATADPAKGEPDYVPAEGLLTWAAGTKDAKPINITIKGDALAEPDEELAVNFGAPNNAKLNDANSLIKLVNDDGAPGDIPVLNLEPIQDKAEGDSGTTTQTITVSLTNNAQQTVTVKYATSDGSATASTQDAKGDYNKTEGTLTFPKGTTSKTFDVPVNGDPIDENDETYNVTLSAATNANIGTATRQAKIANDDFGQITTGPSTSGGPHLRLFGATGSELGGFFTYNVPANSPPYNAGIHVARGDIFKADGTVGADGIDEVIVGPGRGITARVLIMATDGAVKGSFFAFGTQFDGGVYVAAGEIDGDASNGDEIVVGAGPGGGPHVRVVKPKAGGADVVDFIGNFFPYGNFPGGVRVAVADVGGDAKAEIITAPGPGGGPHIKVNRLNNQGGVDVVKEWFAYGNFTGGVSVAAAKNRVVTGAGPGGNPHVRVFDGNGADLGGWYAYNEGFTGGVNVGAGNLDNSTEPEIVTGAGPGGGPHVKVFSVNGSQPFGGGFFAYNPNFRGGVEVSVAVAG